MSYFFLELPPKTKSFVSYLFTELLLSHLIAELPLLLGTSSLSHLAVCQNLVPLVNIKIAGKWMFIPLKMVLYNRY